MSVGTFGRSTGELSTAVEKGGTLPKKGAVCAQWKRCGRPSCRCVRGQLHGPYHCLFWREGGRLRKRYIRQAERRGRAARDGRMEAAAPARALDARTCWPSCADCFVNWRPDMPTSREEAWEVAPASRRRRDDGTVDGDRHFAEYQVEYERRLAERHERLKRDARASYRAMADWALVGGAEDWERVVEQAADDLEDGSFLIERLGSERHLDPRLMATLLVLRRKLIDEHGAESGADLMLIDATIMAYWHVLRTNGWVGNLATVLESEFFSGAGLSVVVDGRDREHLGREDQEPARRRDPRPDERADPAVDGPLAPDDAPIAQRAPGTAAAPEPRRQHRADERGRRPGQHGRCTRRGVTRHPWAGYGARGDHLAALGLAVRGAHALRHAVSRHPGHREAAVSDARRQEHRPANRRGAGADRCEQQVSERQTKP